MDKLKVETAKECIATKVMRVSGFCETEMENLEHMDYRDMKEAVLAELDLRNDMLGTCWHNGYGVYTMWISNGAVMVEIGSNCD